MPNYMLCPLLDTVLTVIAWFKLLSVAMLMCTSESHSEEVLNDWFSDYNDHTLWLQCCDVFPHWCKTAAHLNRVIKECFLACYKLLPLSAPMQVMSKVLIDLFSYSGQ